MPARQTVCFVHNAIPLSRGRSSSSGFKRGRRSTPSGNIGRPAAAWSGARSPSPVQQIIWRLDNQYRQYLNTEGMERLSRAQQNDRNRALLLAAALRVFLARGYHAATLEQIADEAGFSKGAVYSRFGSKADMFLALLTDRIAVRAAQNASAVAELASSGTVAGMIELAWQAERATPGWRLLVTEFRVLAARDPALN